MLNEWSATLTLGLVQGCQSLDLNPAEVQASHLLSSAFDKLGIKFAPFVVPLVIHSSQLTKT